ncbi:MAG: hypothetical protein ACKVT1_08355 [Dehalococcoidia bacterium]
MTERQPAETERWVEVWRGQDPSAIGRLLDAEGIPMRLAARGNWCGTGGGGFDLVGLFRRKPQSRLLVPEPEADRARAVVKK